MAPGRGDRGRAGGAVVLLDEAHLLPNWAARLKGEWDRLRRRALAVHVVATGSSALRLAAGSRESLAGRFERLTLTHWSAASVAEVFGIPPRDAVDLVVRMGSYPGALPLREDRARWTACVREAIVEPAIGRDLLAHWPVPQFAVTVGIPSFLSPPPRLEITTSRTGGRKYVPDAMRFQSRDV